MWFAVNHHWWSGELLQGAIKFIQLFLRHGVYGSPRWWRSCEEGDSEFLIARSTTCPSFLSAWRPKKDGEDAAVVSRGALVQFCSGEVLLAALPDVGATVPAPGFDADAAIRRNRSGKAA